MKSELTSKYKSKAKDSFKTKLRLYLFSSVIKKEKVSFNDFKKFMIEDDLIDTYAADYWQQATDSVLEGYGMRVGEVYNKLKVLEAEDYKDYEDWYVQDFEESFPRTEFEKIINQKHCCYCEVTINDIETIAAKGRIYKKNLRGWSLELERFNSNKEYYADNCAMACYWCNNAKTDEFTKEEFMPVGKAIQKIWKERLK